MRVPFRQLWSQIALLACAATAHTAPLFESSEILDVELTGPFSETMRDKRHREERLFTLVAAGHTLDVAVRLRGKSRVKLCSSPPLRLNFAGADTAGTVFEGLDNVKLVTHCNNSDSYEINVLEEYAAYRIFQLLVETSYRVRLLRISYLATDRPRRKDTVRYGFAIEPLELLAERAGGQPVELPGIRPSHLDTQHLSAVFLAHYVIGNTDFSLVAAHDEEFCCHNGRMIDHADGLKLAPYDFDMSMLVNADYARAQTGSNRRATRQRRYRGYCFDGLDMRGAIAAAVAREPDILALLDEIELETGRQLIHARKYLEGFFREARFPELMLAKFEKNCID